MKVALVGNMNNMLFPIARYLADADFKVSLFLLDEFEHFLPEADEYTRDNRVEIINLDYGKSSFLYQSSGEIKQLFSNYDYIIGTDYAPALLMKGNILLDVYFPAGGDIFDYPFYNVPAERLLPEMYQIRKWQRAKFQKWALPFVGTLSMDPANEILEKYLGVLQMNHIDRIPALPFLYLPQYQEKTFASTKYYGFIEGLRKENDFLVIQHCRQSWVNKESIHYKANEHLIKGFAQFAKDNAESRIKLILLEYGVDVQASKQLIDELDISEIVIWLPKMKRKELLPIIKGCHVCVGEIGRSWFSYGAVFETLSVKTNFMGRRDEGDFRDFCPELYPMTSVENDKDVLNGLTKIMGNPEMYKQKAEEAFIWFRDNAIDNSVNTVLKLVSQKKKGRIRLPIILTAKVKLVSIIAEFGIFLNKLNILAKYHFFKDVKNVHG